MGKDEAMEARGRSLAKSQAKELHIGAEKGKLTKAEIVPQTGADSSPN